MTEECYLLDSWAPSPRALPPLRGLFGAVPLLVEVGQSLLRLLDLLVSAVVDRLQHLQAFQEHGLRFGVTFECREALRQHGSLKC